MTFAEVLLIEFGVLVAGTAVGWLAHVRLFRGDDAGQQADRLSESLAFIGGALGIILGLLLVFAVDHYDSAQQSVRDEAGAAVVVFNAADTFATPERDNARREIVCYLRSVVADDWEALRTGDLTGSNETHEWAHRVQVAVVGFTQSTPAQATTHPLAIEHQLLMDQARQTRLQLGKPEIPPLIWVVIFVASFAFVALLAFHLSVRWPARLMAVVATGLVMMVSIVTLYELDRPYEGWSGSSLQPVGVETTLRQLQDAFPGGDWSPCPADIYPDGD